MYEVFEQNEENSDIIHYLNDLFGRSNDTDTLKRLYKMLEYIHEHLKEGEIEWEELKRGKDQK